MPSVIGTTAGGTNVAVGANYLRTVQSPGADLAGLVAAGTAPLLTFSTPNLRMFKVVVEDINLTTSPDASNSNWSKTVRGLQVTSELFAVFAPAFADDDSTFCYMAPDFNTNAGDVSVRGDVQLAISETGGGFSIVEKAIADALGTTANKVTVTRAAVSGVAIS
jgi:hypothetical protein